MKKVILVLVLLFAYLFNDVIYVANLSDSRLIISNNNGEKARLYKHYCF